MSKKDFTIAVYCLLDDTQIPGQSVDEDVVESHSDTLSVHYRLTRLIINLVLG